MTTFHEQCPTHKEFAYRLDERWKDHAELHATKQEEVCDKFRGVFERLDKQNQKLNWLLGGVAVLCPMMMIFVQLLLTHLAGAKP